jgi:hypothetical protein
MRLGIGIGECWKGWWMGGGKRAVVEEIVGSRERGRIGGEGKSEEVVTGGEWRAVEDVAAARKNMTRGTVTLLEMRIKKRSYRLVQRLHHRVEIVRILARVRQISTSKKLHHRTGNKLNSHGHLRQKLVSLRRHHILLPRGHLPQKYSFLHLQLVHAPQPRHIHTHQHRQAFLPSSPCHPPLPFHHHLPLRLQSPLYHLHHLYPNPLPQLHRTPPCVLKSTPPQNSAVSLLRTLRGTRLAMWESDDRKVMLRTLRGTQLAM